MVNILDSIHFVNMKISVPSDGKWQKSPDVLCDYKHFKVPKVSMLTSDREWVLLWMNLIPAMT